MPRWLRAAAIVILVAAAFRCWTIVSGARPPSDLLLIRQTVLQAITTNPPPPLQQDGTISIGDLDPGVTELGVERIEIQHFDPNAVVMILAGPDGQPGVASVDDNGDAIVDNRAELGATRSDDLCVVAPSADDAPKDEPTLILQRGAYVPLVEFDSSTPAKPLRGIVRGARGDDSWSFIVEFD